MLIQFPPVPAELGVQVVGEQHISVAADAPTVHASPAATHEGVAGGDGGEGAEVVVHVSGETSEQLNVPQSDNKIPHLTVQVDEQDRPKNSTTNFDILNRDRRN